MRRLYLAAEDGPLRAALVDGEDRLEGFWTWGRGRDSLVGARFLGRVRAVDRSLDAAFVDVGLERPGLLPFARCPTPPTEGEALPVEVTRDAVEGKGVRLTARLGDAPKPPDGAAPPLRLESETALHRLLRKFAEIEFVADTRRLAAELEGMAAVRPGWRIEHRPRRAWPMRLADMEAEVEAALEPRVELAGGGWLLFEACRTLTVVDVNSGAVHGQGGERTWLKTNLVAAEEIARQLRLRHIGGIVVVDFIDLKAPERRRQVAHALSAAMSQDWEPWWVGGMSRLGLVELSRRRAGPTLAEMLEADAS